MDGNINEALLGKLRAELRKGDIKLWKAPYTADDGSGSKEIQALAAHFSVRLNLPCDHICAGLIHLQLFALDRQRQNANYRLNNIATIRLQFCPKSVCTNVTTVETKLDISGRDLRQLISDRLNVEASSLKLVCSGKMIQNEISLNTQGVQHNKTILCMYFSADNKHLTSEAEKAINAVRKARRGAELLAGSSSSAAQEYDAQITDQNGRTIDIPDDERKSLMIALGLHEKGRAILKKKKYSYALLFLLEADTEFRQCRAEILNCVDNFAILCLDICWCYLCLKNLDALPDVSERLKTCETSFKRSYGESMHRLLAIKGSTGHEIALFTRLYVLQGIVAYYEGNYNAARDLLSKAKFYSSKVEVNEEVILSMLNLGFTTTEARLALRACNGDVTIATGYAFRRREEKEKIRGEEMEKSRKRKLARSLGKCADGSDINVDVYEQMVNQLGFDKDLCAEALKQSNNNLDKAIELIQEQPHLLQHVTTVSETLIKQVVHLGFDRSSSHSALQHFNGNYQEAVDYLLTHGGAVPPEWRKKEVASRSKSEDIDAMKKMAKVVSSDEESYLDVDVDEELEYITTYLALINSVLP